MNIGTAATTGARRSPVRGRADAGHTLLELLFVVAILGILMMMTLPVLHKAQVRAKRTACLHQLHQVGLAAHDFAHDHNNQFPHQVPTNAGGTREFAHAGFALSGEFYFAYRHFQALSNALDTPRILRCPADDQREKATRFSELQNRHISYFAGLGADYLQPASWLAGDGSMQAETLAGGAILRLSTNVAPAWSFRSHEARGNILFADGHVEGMGNARLQGAFPDMGQSVVYLLPPFVPSGPAEESPQHNTVGALEQFFALQSGGRPPAAAGQEAAPPPPGSSPTPASVPNARAAAVPSTQVSASGGTAEGARTSSSATTSSTSSQAGKRLPAPGPELASHSTSTNAPGTERRPGAKAGQRVAGDEIAEGTLPARVLAFMMRPELNPFWWGLVLLLAILVALTLGWWLYRERARRRGRPILAPRYARPT